MDVEAPAEETLAPSFCLLELSITQFGAEYVFMYNGKRFYVTMSTETLRGEGTLLDDFNKFMNDLDDPDTMTQFEDWVLDPLDDFMHQAAPTPGPGTRKSFTLLDYFSPPTFAFELTNEQGKLSAVQTNYSPQVHGDSSPRTRIVDSAPGPGISENPAISRSTLPSVPIFRASQLQRVWDGLCDEEMSDVPKKIRQIGSDRVFFFKAGFKDRGHLREMELLSQINGSDRFEAPFQTSRLVGLVVWDGDEDSLMGFLLDYIDGETLDSRVVGGASMETRTRWMNQVEATVRRLHETSIVWGDAKADNVMVNQDGNAVVVDFGGGYTPEYIRPDLQQTVQGDLIGLDHMRDVMGVRRDGE